MMAEQWTHQSDRVGARPSAHRRGMRMFAAPALVLITMPWLALPAAADSLTLKSAVRARGDDGVILLRDIAELRGAEALRFAELIVATVPTGTPARELAVEEIRRKLEQAGANWAKIDLEGRRVIVRPRLSDAVGPPGACSPATVEPTARGAENNSGSHSAGTRNSSGASAGEADATNDAQRGATRAEPMRFDPVRGPRRGAADPVHAAAVINEGSVRALVAEALMRALDEPADGLRMTFEGLDATTLAEVPPGLRFEIEPIGVLDADRAEFAVRWWRDGRVERRSNLSAFPEIARMAAVAKRELRKGDQPAESDLEAAVCWVRPSDRSRVVRPGATGGRVLAMSVRNGDPLLDTQFERQVLVKRGDRIIVRSVVGSLALSVDAIAQSDGREGEVIEFVRVGTQGNRRDRSSFSALVTARGEAVIPHAARTM